jgi:hypothetical protein
MMSNRSGPLATKWWVLLVAVAAGVVACAKDDGAAAPRAPADAMPASVAVSGSEVELGVHLGKSRESTAVSAFSISRLPTTVHQYRQCVQAGVCSAPSAELAPCGERERGVDGATFQTVDGADRLPVTCTHAVAGRALLRLGRRPAAAGGRMVARRPRPQGRALPLGERPGQLRTSLAHHVLGRRSLLRHCLLAVGGSGAGPTREGRVAQRRRQRARHCGRANASAFQARAPRLRARGARVPRVRAGARRDRFHLCGARQRVELPLRLGGMRCLLFASWS